MLDSSGLMGMLWYSNYHESKCVIFIILYYTIAVNIGAAGKIVYTLISGQFSAFHGWIYLIPLQPEPAFSFIHEFYCPW
jgi:hypothetical protein